MLKSKQGYFGEYGGCFVPEILHATIKELEQAYRDSRSDPEFWKQFLALLSSYSCRPTPLSLAENLTARLAGAKIYIKREDLNHSGAHKFNNVLGQALLAKRMKKTRLIAETGAGQHGVATATIAAKFGFECTIYMGAEDVKRQYPNVFWMKKLGADVQAVSAGSATLKDAINQALRDWSENMDTTHYLLGTACGPHPFPEMVAWFQSVIGQEAREQILKVSGSLPQAVYACVGGGSNAIGIFSGFLEDKDVRLVAVEAAGKGLSTGQHATRIGSEQAKPGIVQGYKSYFLQDDDGQMLDTYSVAAGLDYVGISPILAELSDKGRVEFKQALDSEVLEACSTFMAEEGLIPALESAHALAQVIKDASQFGSDKCILVNLSGRGDKDIFTIAEAFGDEGWREYLKSLNQD